MDLYGKNWKRELEARTGRMGQIAGIKKYCLTEGSENAVEQIEIRTGTGLRFTVSPQHALDMSMLEYCGTPLSWQTQNGDKHPAYFENNDIEWLRTAAGGMLMTCGFQQVGAPCEDEEESLGLHGRAHHIPASQVNIREFWEQERLFFEVSGLVQETRMFGENITMHRSYRCEAGTNEIILTDKFRNNGFNRVPFMLLYHWNFGFPLLDENTELIFPSSKVTPREPEIPMENFDRWHSPIPGYNEHVYFHSGLATKDLYSHSIAEVCIANPEFPINNRKEPLKLFLNWSADTLPNLIQWKMPGESMHVLGIEPANCLVHGRAYEREQDTLKYLDPGEETESINIIKIISN